MRGAVDWLRTRPEVDPERIAALGLSMGGEVALTAAASGTGLAAVVAEGASSRVPADLVYLPADASGLIQRLDGEIMWALAGLMTDAAPPIPLTEAVAAADVPILLIVGQAADEVLPRAPSAARRPPRRSGSCRTRRTSSRSRATPRSGRPASSASWSRPWAVRRSWRASDARGRLPAGPHPGWQALSAGGSGPRALPQRVAYGHIRVSRGHPVGRPAAGPGPPCSRCGAALDPGPPSIQGHPDVLPVPRDARQRPTAPGSCACGPIGRSGGHVG